ncbi:hypothetical protein XELAEV_18020050mg [Xenopus laevis]|uniref:Uncharacterized protein n=1 Tax=Xenopus laevis TaxID=8355 RepID=A0A974HQM9_XENLA|nr:hypothetical protein XELAEV_18020050mg [Xenopus laevis]
MAWAGCRLQKVPELTPGTQPRQVDHMDRYAIHSLGTGKLSAKGILPGRNTTPKCKVLVYSKDPVVYNFFLKP